MASVDASDLPSAVDAIEEATATPGDCGRSSSPTQPASGQRTDSLEPNADGITTAIDSAPKSDATALPDDGQLPAEGGKKGFRAWCCSTRKRLQYKKRKAKKQTADAEKSCCRERSTNLCDRLMEVLLRHPAPAPAHASPPRTNTGMCLDTPDLAAASPSAGRTFNGLISTDDVIPSSAFLDEPGYTLGFSVHKTGRLEELQARFDQVERGNEAAEATLLQLQEQAAGIDELQETIAAVEAGTIELRAQVAAETRRAEDNAAEVAVWKHRSNYLEGDRNASMRQLRHVEASTNAIREQLHGKEAELHESRSMAAAEMAALQNKVQQETAQATKLSAKCDTFKASVKKARMTTTTTALELKNQTALLSKLRLEKQELNVSAERQALELQAKLAAITVEGEKQVNLLIQQRDKTQAAADVALAKLHECEQKLQQETARARQSADEQCETFQASIATAQACTTRAEQHLENQKALVSKLQLEKEELNLSAERQALELHAKLAAMTAERRAHLLIQQRDKTQAAADVALARLQECEQKLQEEKARAKESTVKQREIFKDSIKKAGACTALAEQQLENQTAMVSKLQLEKEEIKAAAQIQLTELQTRLFHEAVQVVMKAQDARDLMRDDKVRAQQKAERYRRQRNKQMKIIEALEAKLEGRLAGQERPEDDGKGEAAYQLKLMRQELEEERAARQAAQAEVARLKSEQDSNRAGCEESKGSDEETAGLRHKLHHCEASLNYQGQRADHFENQYAQLLQKFNGLGAQDMPVGPSPTESEMQLSLNNLHAQVLELQAKLAKQEERYAAKDAECYDQRKEKQEYMGRVIKTELAVDKAKREAEALKQERDNLAAKCAALTDECTRLNANQLELLDCMRAVDGELGKGGQAVVKSMTIKHDDERVEKLALKVFKYHCHATREFKMGTLAYLTGFAPKIEQLIECKKVVTNVSRGDEPIGGVVRMEYIEGRTLMQIIKDLHGESMSLSMLDGIVYNFNEFFKKCEHFHLLHRDLKPDNIMLLADESLKVIDYAYAKLHAVSTLPLEEQFVTNGGHTPSFMAPEALTKKKGYRDDIAVDMFSAGVIGVTCALGKFNFFDEEYFTLMDHFTALQFQGTALPEALGGLAAATQKFYDVFERQRERIEGWMEAKVEEGKVSQNAAHILQCWISQDQAIRRQTLGWPTAEMFGRA